LFNRDLDEVFAESRFNPVLWLAIKHEHGSQAIFKRFSWRLQLGAYGLALLFAIPTLFSRNAFFAYWPLWLIGCVLAYVLSFGADIAYILAARSSAEVRGEFWEALRLTLLPSVVLVEGKYLNAQLRAWRWLLMETAARHFIVAALIFPILGLGLTLEQGLLFLVLSGWMILALFLALGFLYVREPITRMRAMVALSFVTALRTRDESAANFLAIGIAFSLRLMQVFLIISWSAQGALFSLDSALICFLPILYLALAYYLFYGVYRQICAWALKAMMRSAQAGD
jgi:hypothetical protein